MQIFCAFFQLQEQFTLKRCNQDQFFFRKDVNCCSRVVPQQIQTQTNNGYYIKIHKEGTCVSTTFGKIHIFLY
jgi:hypothetical protein